MSRWDPMKVPGAQFGEGAILRYSSTPALRPQGIEDEDDDEDEYEAPRQWHPMLGAVME
jgi:hypothetical protein